MATKKKAYLVHEGTQWYIVEGKKKIDVGRSKSYAEKLLAEHNAK